MASGNGFIPPRNFFQWLKVRLHGTQQAAQLVRDMLQRDLLRGNSVYMVDSCIQSMYRKFLGSMFFKESCLRQHVLHGNFKFKLKLPPGLAAVVRLLRAACGRVNAPVAFLCFYFATQLSRRSRAACRVPCKRSLRLKSSSHSPVAEMTVCGLTPWHQSRAALFIPPVNVHSPGSWVPPLIATDMTS